MQPRKQAWAMTALCTLAGLAAPASAHAAGDTPSRIEWHATCPVQAPPGTKCGTLITPERPGGPAGRTVHVPIAVIPAPDPAHKPADPFLFLMGGTGAGFSVLGELGSLPALTGRDVIVVEQRGNAMADPFYGCDSVPHANNLHVSWNSGPLNDPANIEKCRAELLSRNIDLDAYATPQGAADLVVLRQLLGVKTWNVFGVSYGGRVATTLLRQDPAAMRTMILDSAQITGANFSGWDRLDAVGAFFDRCDAAPDCGKHFPGLKAAFESTVARLAAHPARVTIDGKPDQLTAQGYITLVTFALYDLGFDAFTRVPAGVVAAGHGDYSLIMTPFGLYAHEPPPVSAATPGWPTARYAHIAQQVNMLCAEEYGYHAPEYGMEAARRAGWSATTLNVVLEDEKRTRAVCRQWHFKLAPVAQSQPPVGDVPTLILNGDHDPVAPAAHGAVALHSLTHARQVVFRWTGHAVLAERTACAGLLVATFLAQPGGKLDPACAAAIPEPAWLASDPARTPNLDILRAAAANAVADSGIPGRGIYMQAPHIGVEGVVASGMRDPATKTPLTGTETFRIASQTKVFTAAAILRLVEDGKLRVDQPIAGLLSPNLEQILRRGGYDPSRITLREMLSHTAGLPDYADDPGYQTEVAAHPTERWTRLEQVTWAITRLKAPGAPGKVYLYSDTGYVLLGDIIERQTGLAQAAAYRSLIDFKRLGLTDTWFETLEPAPANAPPRAHQFAGGADVTQADPSFDLYGGGGLVSTLRDQAHWMSALFGGRVFHHPQTLALMLTIPPVNRAAAGGNDYALGIHRDSFSGVDCWGHSGFFGSGAYYCPRLDLTLAASRYTHDEPLGYDPTSALNAAITLVKLRTEPASPPVRP